MRKTYLDNIRFITVAIVVLYHVIYIFNGITEFGIIGPFSDNQPQDIFMYIVYPWFMLLLFVVSGISARYELEKLSEKEFIRKRTRKLLVPSTIGLLVFGWITGYYNILIGGGLDSVLALPFPVRHVIMSVSGTGVLWFIQLLWLYSLLLVLVRKLEKDKLFNLCKNAGVAVSIALTAVIFIFAQIFNMPMLSVYRFGIYGAGFFIGYFVYSHDEVMDKNEKGWPVYSVAALVSCIAFAKIYYGESYVELSALKSTVCNIFAWFTVLAILTVMKKWGNFENGFTKFMIKESWGLYIFHYTTLAMTAYYLRTYAGNMPPVVIYILVAISAFLGAFILNNIISRIPVIRWCVLGIKKEKNNKR